jgi:hypothetical protein
VFQRLRENKLYAKFKKCEFGVIEVDFLGHGITQEGEGNFGLGTA